MNDFKSKRYELFLVSLKLIDYKIDRIGDANQNLNGVNIKTKEKKERFIESSTLKRDRKSS